MNRLFFNVLGCALILFSACGKSSFNVALDNPTKENLTFEVDKKEYKLGPNENVNIEMEAGKHTLNANKNKYEFEVKEDGILNAAGSEYVLWKDVYFDRKKMDDIPADALKDDSVMIDGIKYYGEIKVFSKETPYIQKAWDYDLQTPFPDTISLNNQSFITKQKIFRKQDFIDEYNIMNGIDAEMQQLMDSVLKAKGVDLKDLNIAPSTKTEEVIKK
ncbi:MAG: hypothetical protein K1X92_19040 [Bacteroidia bacterium]|nr:hypothetical protein [Bacteroidia bacterium]